MSSMIDYIRQLNRESVHIQDDWLIRLKYCDTANVEAAKPEIELASTSNRPHHLKLGESHPRASAHTNASTDSESLPANSEPELSTEREDTFSFGGTIDISQTASDVVIEQYNTDSLIIDEICIGDEIPTIMEETSNPKQPEPPSEESSPLVSPSSSGWTDTSLQFQNKLDDADHGVIDDATAHTEQQLLFIATDDELEVTDQAAQLQSDADPTLQNLVYDPSALHEPGAEENDKIIGIDHLQPIDFVAAADTNLKQSESLPESTAAINRSAKRFDYKATKKHKRIDALANNIVTRFPPTIATTILLVSLDHASDVDATSSKVASCMAMQQLGDIVLVDGNLRDRSLTDHFGHDQRPGMAEIINRKKTVDSLVAQTDNSRLMFLAAGTGGITYRKLDSESMIRMIAALKKQFRYSIINGGSISEPHANLLAKYVDAVYLMVDMTESDQHFAKDAIDHLHSIGARVAGCVATKS